MRRWFSVLFIALTVPVATVMADPVLDTDGDGLPDATEDRNRNGVMEDGETDPMNADTDNGGEADGSEVQGRRDPLKMFDDLTFDQDRDGLTRQEEQRIGTDPMNPDTDGDGLNDKEDPFPLDREYKTDDDGDGLPDEYETEKGLSNTVRSDAEEDTDGDGLSNLAEFTQRTDPHVTDTDQDGVTDGQEVELGSDPGENACLQFGDPEQSLIDMEGHWSEGYVRLLQQTKIQPEGTRIISGYKQGPSALFLPDRNISRFELLKIALLSSCIRPRDDTGEPDFHFLDVRREPRPHEEEDAALKRRVIYTAYEQGIVEGYPNGTFRPDNPVNRAEALKILFRATNLEPFDDASYAGTFSDVPDDEWYSPYVENALSYDFVKGYGDGTFRPGQPITRAEASKLVFLMMISNPHVNGYDIPVEEGDLEKKVQR